MPSMFLVYDGEKNTTLTVSLGKKWNRIMVVVGVRLLNAIKTQIGDHINLTQKRQPIIYLCANILQVRFRDNFLFQFIKAIHYQTLARFGEKGKN